MSYRPSLTPALATAAYAGLIKPDGITLSVRPDGTTTVVGLATASINPATAITQTDKFFVNALNGAAKIASGTHFGLFSSVYNGLTRVDLGQRYGAPLDGSSHPLAAIGLAAAQARYPNAGLTATTDLSKFEQDTAAWLQAEYELRTGSGGVIGLADGAAMMVSQQLYLQNGSRVWFHGGRGTSLLTEGTGTVPAVRVSGASFGEFDTVPRPLSHLCFRAFNSGRAYFGSTAGAPYPGLASSAVLARTPGGGYRSNASALLIDNGSVEAVFEGLHWVNYDAPLVWGDNTWNITFRHCFAESNNSGVSWSQATGLNSMERMRFEGSNISNNNIGVAWNASFADSRGAIQAQGGSLHIVDCSLDYNIQRHVDYTGGPIGNTNLNNEIHIRGGHIEANVATMGGNNSWIELRSGALFMSDVPFYVSEGSFPGIVTIGDGAFGSMTNCRVNGSIPLFRSSTGNPKVVSGTGNLYQATTVRPQLLSDANGIAMQPLPIANFVDVYGDAGGFPLDYQGRLCKINFSGRLTIANDSVINHAIGTVIDLLTVGSASVTLVAGSGVNLDGSAGYKLDGGGKMAKLMKVGINHWNAAGMLTL